MKTSVVIRRNASENSVTIDGDTWDLSKMGKPARKKLDKKLRKYAEETYGQNCQA